VIPHRLSIALLLAQTLLVVGCAQLAPAPPVPAEPEPVAGEVAPPEDPRARLQYHVLVAELAAHRNLPAEAARHYLEAAQLGRDPELAENATRYALLAGDEEQALLGALRWSSLAPDAVPPRELIARNHLRQGRLDALYAESTAIIARHPAGRDEGFREVALLLSSDLAFADPALAVMQRLVNDDPQRAAAHYAYGLLAVRLGRHELGVQQADIALGLERDWPEAYLLKLGAQVRAGLLPDARRTLEQALARAADPVLLRLSYARLLLEADQNEAAAEQYRQVLLSDDNNPDARYALALLALQGRQPDVAYAHLLTLFESGQRRDEAAWFLAHIEEQRGNWREAHNWYGAVTGGSRALDALLRRAYTLYKSEGLDPALAYLTGLRNRGFEIGPRLYAAEAELYYEDGQPARALQRYSEGLREFPADSDLLYGTAMMHAEMGDIPAAEQVLRGLLAGQPDDARSLNALGYLLSNHSTRYQEAFQLIERALQLTPDDPAVIDSMGWIHYRLGNLEKALELLREAFKRDPDPEIAAHLGEVLWQLGQRESAEDVWRTALAEHPEHRVLRETVDRLRP
jgi:tetratricopeptide (TPR) repeat protein